MGDQVVGKDCGGNAFAGLLIIATPGADTCNGRVLPSNLVNQANYVTLGECLHVDDALPAKAATA